MDMMASLVIHAKVDDVMKLLMEKLEIKIPQFNLNRWAKVSLEESKSGKETLEVSGIDASGCPY